LASPRRSRDTVAFNGERGAKATNSRRQKAASEYVVTIGAFNGQGGFFTRDENNSVIGVDLSGRLLTGSRRTYALRWRSPESKGFANHSEPQQGE
jgi:hypothetical protein